MLATMYNAKSYWVFMVDLDHHPLLTKNVADRSQGRVHKSLSKPL